MISRTLYFIAPVLEEEEPADLMTLLHDISLFYHQMISSVQSRRKWLSPVGSGRCWPIMEQRCLHICRRLLTFHCVQHSSFKPPQPLISTLGCTLHLRCAAWWRNTICLCLFSVELTVGGSGVGFHVCIMWLKWRIKEYFFSCLRSLLLCSVLPALRFGWTRQKSWFTSRERRTPLWSITCT